MSVQEDNLNIRLEALFHNEIVKELRQTADNVIARNQVQAKNHALKNQIERLKVTQDTLKQLTEDLVVVGNKCIDNFEKEIENVNEPEKSNAVDKLKDLVTEEIRELVKTETLNKFHDS